MKNKLVELVLECCTFTPEFKVFARSHAEYVANHLINNDVTVREHGKWEDNADGTHWCSECGHDATYTYDGIEVCGVCCPFCGADMRGEGECLNG